MVASLVGSGEKIGDKVLRGTMLVDNIFQNCIHRPELHCHKIDRDCFFDLMNLCENLSRLEGDWCKDRIIHLGIFVVILNLINDAKYGKHITANGLKCIISILSSYEDDPEKKELVMAQLASTEIDGESGM
jgi:hypothetical protein